MISLSLYGGSFQGDADEGGSVSERMGRAISAATKPWGPASGWDLSHRGLKPKSADQSDLTPTRHTAAQVGKSLGSADNQRRSRGRGGDWRAKGGQGVEPRKRVWPALQRISFCLGFPARPASYARGQASSHEPRAAPLSNGHSGLCRREWMWGWVGRGTGPESVSIMDFLTFLGA